MTTRQEPADAGHGQQPQHERHLRHRRTDRPSQLDDPVEPVRVRSRAAEREVAAVGRGDDVSAMDEQQRRTRTTLLHTHRAKGRARRTRRSVGRDTHRRPRRALTAPEPGLVHRYPQLPRRWSAWRSSRIADRVLISTSCRSRSHRQRRSVLFGHLVGKQLFEISKGALDVAPSCREQSCPWTGCNEVHEIVVHLVQRVSAAEPIKQHVGIPVRDCGGCSGSCGEPTPHVLLARDQRNFHEPERRFSPASSSSSPMNPGPSDQLGNDHVASRLQHGAGHP